MNLYRIFAAFSLCLVALTGSAQTPSISPSSAPYDADIVRAQALLKSAINEYQTKGDSAFAEFSRQGPFVDGELYIYVVDTAGVMLASGGPSASLVGKHVVNVLDDDLKIAFQQAISQPEDGTVHSAEYRWWNWRHSKVERKRVFYQRVGERIISVGYYMPRSSPEEAKQLLQEVSDQVRQDAATTLIRINKHDKKLSHDDLYAFVVDLRTNRFVAHGFLPRLIGTDFKKLRSIDGKPIGEEMLKLMNSGEQGEVSYLWRNPITGQSEFKKTFLLRVDEYFVAVGCYANQ